MCKRTEILLFVMLVLQGSGCGFGGFTTPANSTPPVASSAATVKIGGVLSKGIIAGGTVRIYSLQGDGSLGTLLAEGTTNAFGRYSSQIGSGGPLVLQGSGRYSDEATGTLLSIGDATPLLAVIDTVARYQEVAVTPLTHLAVLQLKEASATSVAAANRLVSDIFKFDVVGTQPVPPSAAQVAGASQQQRDYTLALAALSQLVADRYQGDLNAALGDLSGEIAQKGTLGGSAAQRFQEALQRFLASPRNETGIAPGAPTNLVNVGGSVLPLKVATAGTLEAGSVLRTLSVSLLLPPGVTVRADFTAHPFLPLATALVPTGTISVDSASFSEASYLPPTATSAGSLSFTLALSPASSGVGEVATVYCDLPPGATLSASDFVLSGFAARSADGALLSQVSGTLQ